MKSSPIAPVQSEKIVSVQQPPAQIQSSAKSSAKQSVKQSATSILEQSVPFVKSKETSKEDVTKIGRQKHVKFNQEHNRKVCLEQCGALYPDLIASVEQNWLMVVLVVVAILSVLGFLSYQNASSGKASSGGLVLNGSILLTILTGVFGLYILNLRCWGLPNGGHSGIEENVDASDGYGSGEGTLKVNLRRLNSRKSSAMKIYYNEAKMAQRLPSSVEEIWKIIVDEVTKCVLDDSPNDCVLANYLGRHVENEYRVSHIEHQIRIQC